MSSVPSRVVMSASQDLTQRRPVQVEAPGVLVTPRLTLRPLKAGDRSAWTELVESSREHLRGRMNVVSDNESAAHAFERVLGASEEGEQRGTQWRRVVVLPGGALAGMVHVLGISRGAEFAGDAGWWIAPALCGNGIASEAGTAMLAHAFRDLPEGLGLHVVRGGIAPDNIASKKAAARVGFARVPGAFTRVRIGEGWQEQELWEARAGEACV
jgi:[ribosomal protein S5]-alanine N-acetyltransferase